MNIGLISGNIRFGMTPFEYEGSGKQLAEDWEKKRLSKEVKELNERYGQNTMKLLGQGVQLTPKINILVYTVLSVLPRILEKRTSSSLNMFRRFRYVYAVTPRHLEKFFKRIQCSPENLKANNFFLEKLAEAGLITSVSRSRFSPFRQSLWTLTNKGEILLKTLSHEKVVEYTTYTAQSRADGTALKDSLQEQEDKLGEEKKQFEEKLRSFDQKVREQKDIVERAEQALKSSQAFFETQYSKTGQGSDQYRLDQAQLKQQAETLADETRLLHELERQATVGKSEMVDVILQIGQNIHEINRRQKDLEIMKVQTETMAQANNRIVSQEQEVQFAQTLKEIQEQAAAREALINEQNPELRTQALDVIRRRIAEKAAVQEAATATQTATEKK